MRLLVVSDFHGSAKAFWGAASRAEDAGADAVVICGDITHFGSVEEARGLFSHLDRLRLPVYFVPGNCDPPSLVGIDMEGARCIHGLHEVFQDVTLVGVGGGLVSPFHTPFELTEEEVADALNRGLEHAPIRRWLVLVSHHPPKGTRADVASTGGHIGSVSVRRFIEEKKPHAVFCGHIHESRAVDRIGRTLVVNPGPAKHGCCALADFDDEKIRVKLDHLY